MTPFDDFFKRDHATPQTNPERNAAATTNGTTGSAPHAGLEPDYLHSAVPGVTEKVQQILDAGVRPASLYLAIDARSHTPVTLRLADPELRAAILVFTSGYQAMDYLQASKIPGGVHEFPAAAFPSYLQQWKHGDAGALCFDRCPRCAVYLALPFKHGLSQAEIWKLLAIHKATQLYQVQRALRSYWTPSKVSQVPGDGADRLEQRKTLRLIRDHLDCSVPYLHWMIALEAHAAHDEAERAAALLRLSQFDATFHGKALSTMSSEVWEREMIECNIGLAASYEMLKP